MHRTNINLAEDQMRGLKYLATDLGRPVSELIRESIDEFLAKRIKADAGMLARIGTLLTRVRDRSSKFSSDEIEADITAASDEVRASEARKRKRKV
jgi:predicted DNA-binding protein